VQWSDKLNREYLISSSEQPLGCRIVVYKKGRHASRFILHLNLKSQRFIIFAFQNGWLSQPPLRSFGNCISRFCHSTTSNQAYKPSILHKRYNYRHLHFYRDFDRSWWWSKPTCLHDNCRCLPSCKALDYYQSSPNTANFHPNQLQYNNHSLTYTHPQRRYFAAPSVAMRKMLITTAP
jgi:hypothetical protein